MRATLLFASRMSSGIAWVYRFMVRADIGVAQQLLLHLHIHFEGTQQSGVAVPERMPADSADSDLGGGGN